MPPSLAVGAAEVQRLLPSRHGALADRSHQVRVGFGRRPMDPTIIGHRVNEALAPRPVRLLRVNVAAAAVAVAVVGGSGSAALATFATGQKAVPEDGEERPVLQCAYVAESVPLVGLLTYPAARP